MSVESKIRELWQNPKQLSEEVLDEKVAGDQTPPTQGSSKKESSEDMLKSTSSEDNSISSATSGDQTPPTQGSSNPNPEQQDLSGSDDKGGLTSPVGKNASAKASKTGLKDGEGAGDAPNFSDDEDPRNVVNQGSSKGNVYKEETDMEDEEFIEEEIVDFDDEEEVEDIEEEVEDFSGDLAALFEGNEELTEDFRGKATSLFEAMVTARTNAKIATIEEQLINEASSLMEEFRSDLTEKVDQYLNYVVEQWVADNEVAIEDGLRTDITESFIEGLKGLFEDHYVEVPEEKYDVIGEQNAKIEELQAKLDESISAKVELHNENTKLQKETVLTRVCEDLARTDAEKFADIISDVEFESAELFEEKLNVIKENYFPKAKTLTEDSLEDGFDSSDEIENSDVAKYAAAISKSAKF